VGQQASSFKMDKGLATFGGRESSIRGDGPGGSSEGGLFRTKADGKISILEKGGGRAFHKAHGISITFVRKNLS